ncbi:ABC transporter permease [Alicyclobacillus dauci]|uniref:ABC transporter permease n=1 Tax=Alicyclobacillus dauci TaxID=1475485 RepID=A0ABY6Z0L5_9BACL|nr:ABC transporter permease [Alicyclobacillus dauci]WAH36295.1 ABC transporter permease [Alicyclobacillus dauci]
MNTFFQTMVNEAPEIFNKVGQHIYLSIIAIALACIISIPLGIYLTRHPKLATPVIVVVSIIQTIPSLALLGFMIPLFGIGTLPALIALLLYALLPIVRNTYTGILEVDKSLLEAGKGMGMTRQQVLWMVELPLSRSVIMAGVRTSTVQTIGVATLATFIGAGGLGDLIIRGIDMIDTQLILAGAIPAALLAILFDFLLLWLDRVFTPKGMRSSGQVDGTVTQQK